MRKLCFGFLARDYVPFRFVASIMKLAEVDRRGPRTIEGRFLGVRSGPMIDVTRNEIVKSFLASKADWLLFCDDDMLFEPDDVYTLLRAADERERPVIGGLCFRLEDDRLLPTMYLKSDVFRNDYAVIAKWNPGDIIKCDVTGAAFLLVHRSVYEKIRESGEKPFDRVASPDTDGDMWGEDWSFCARLEKLGIPLYVHTGVSVGHMKLYPYSERDYIAPGGLISARIDALLPQPAPPDEEPALD